MCNSLPEVSFIALSPYLSGQKMWKNLPCNSFHSPTGPKGEARASKNLAKLAALGKDSLLRRKA